MRTLRDLQQQLSLSTENGLSAEAVAQSRKLFGVNRLTPLPREPLWKKFLEKFDEPIIKILLAAALLSMVVDLFRANPAEGQADDPTRYWAGGAAVAVILAAVGGAYLLKRGRWIPSILF